jgi:thioredoxin-related protein
MIGIGCFSCLQRQGKLILMNVKPIKTIGMTLITVVLMTTSGFGESNPLIWYPFEKGVALGKNQGKKVYIHFWADWCGYCRTMEKETFQNPLVKKRLAADYIAIKVDTDREKILSEKFRIRGLPDNWFLSKNGDIVGHRPGYIPAELFLKILESISANETE